MQRLAYLMATVALLFVTLMAGCHVASRVAGLAIMSPKANSQPGSPGAPADGQGAGQAASEFGNLRISVIWPDGPGHDLRGYQAQLIPNSTSRIDLSVKAGSTTVATASVVRQAGQATASADVLLQAGNNLSLEARAYAPGKGDPIASGQAAGVVVLAGKDNDATLTLGSLFVPAIASFSVNVGKVGDSIDLFGQNLNPAWAAPPIVTFEGTGASVSASIVATTSSSITVNVPAGGAVGRVVVAADGVPSVSNAIFWVASALAISAGNKPSWDPSTDPDSRTVIWNTSLAFTATPTWVLRSGKLASDYGSTPAPAWSRSNAAAGSYLDSTAVNASFLAGSQYASASCKASLGSLTSNAINVSAETLTVTVTPASARLGVAADRPFATFRGEAKWSSGATNSALSYTSSDPASVSIDGNGKATIVNGSKYGTAIITASSLIATASATASAVQTNYRVSLYAGTGTAGNADGPREFAQFNKPDDIAAGPGGVLYIADTDSKRVRAISAVGNVTTLAGSTSGFADGTGAEAKFTFLRSVAVDPNGNLVVVDERRLRRVTSSGVVSTLAGTGQQGSQDGASQSATFMDPTGAAVDSQGNVYVADVGKIRKVTPQGDVSTIAGDGSGNQTVDGTGALAAFNKAFGVALAGEGDLLITEQSGRRIRRSSLAGVVTTWVGGGQSGADGLLGAAGLVEPTGIDIDASGSVYIAESGAGKVRKISKDGYVQTFNVGGFFFFYGLAVDSNGVVWIAERDGHVIRKLEPVP
jgi:sugar lactone lactonase YvrE